jgi:hypothetical protein
MRSLLALLILLACAGTCNAAVIRSGATMQVKENAIWFQNAADLAHWQALKKTGDAAALVSYQDGLLKNRDAWQFLKPLAVRIRSARPKAHWVDVEMTSEGRMKGSKWLLDADAIGP